MNRRSFLASSVTVSALAAGARGSSGTMAAGIDQTSAQYYELRLYQLRRGHQHDLINEYLQAAMLPAMNRIGIAPIGVFEVMAGPESPAIYTLIPYNSLEVFGGAYARMSADPEYQQRAALVINAPPNEPAYERTESSLMVAFDGMPQIRPPNFGERQARRIFELRTYESHSKKANKKKIEMFNTGEIAIFRRNGLQPVFFGETLIGDKLPQLTYMLTFDSMESHDKNWAKFVSDPEWKRLSTTPGFTDADIVSNISNMFLRPAPYSQI
jgi:NIPSNAP protein